MPEVWIMHLVHVRHLVGQQRPLSSALLPHSVDGWLQRYLAFDPCRHLHCSHSNSPQSMSCHMSWELMRTLKQHPEHHY